MLNIVVCAKVVTDPEAPVSTFRIDPEARRALPAQGVPPVVNPYDENGLEAALKIKEAQEARVTVVSAGKDIPKAVVRKCLAVGADDLAVLDDASFEEMDGASTARVLAAAIAKLGGYDLVLTGRMAADTGAGQVGTGLAELLGIPAVTMARKIEVDGGVARVERVVANGTETVEVPLPCLVVVSHEIGELRSANVKGLMAAQKQPFTSWSAADLGIDTSAVQPLRPLKLYIPEKGIDCEIIAGATPEEAGASLAQTLKQNKLI